jgi:nanoRNase/pAp phosphatase (c-di-AMP/oligoRNAs hydrolase)
VRRANQSFPANHVLMADADSAARVLYNWFGGVKAFPQIRADMLDAVDKADSAKFSREDILNPASWDLLSFVMDPRTGLGRFRDFRISNYDLMMALVDHCRTHSIEQTLELPDVRERVELYRAHQELFIDQIRRCTKAYGNLAVLDLRDEEVIYVGNRFMIYALFPEANISMHVLWGVRKQNTVLAMGKSILNRTCRTNIGELALTYGGGGHAAAGTCQVANDAAERVIAEIAERIQADHAAAVVDEELAVV